MLNEYTNAPWGLHSQRYITFGKPIYTSLHSFCSKKWAALKVTVVTMNVKCKKYYTGQWRWTLRWEKQSSVLPPSAKEILLSRSINHDMPPISNSLATSLSLENGWIQLTVVTPLFAVWASIWQMYPHRHFCAQAVANSWRVFVPALLYTNDSNYKFRKMYNSVFFPPSSFSFLLVRVGSALVRPSKFSLLLEGVRHIFKYNSMLFTLAGPHRWE